MSRIAIIGGHGQVALRLAGLLADAGHEVTGLIRNPAHTTNVESNGARAVVMDVERADTDAIAERLRGHDAVVWSAGAGGGDPARTRAVDHDAAIRSIDAAERAGVRRYVMVSYLGAGPDHGVPPDDAFFPYAEAKAAADAYLRRSRLDWTILGPGRLTLDDPSGRIALVDGKQRIHDNATSRDNVAQVAAAVLATPATIGRTIGFVDGETPIREAIAPEA